MDNVDDGLQQQVDAIGEKVVREQSKGIYMGAAAKFLFFLREHLPERLTATFGRAMRHIPDGATEKVVLAAIKAYLKAQPRRPAPVVFENVTANDVQLWMTSLRKRSGEPAGKSTYGTSRSAVLHLFRMYGVLMDPAVASRLTVWFKGLKRELADRAARGEGKVTEGKLPLEHSLMIFLMETSLASPKKGATFARVYLLLTWNLMCRAGNTGSIHHNHLEWKDDALGVYFAHQKNDQEGDRPRDARHVFANPLRPAICPILALAIYWTCFGFRDGSTKLFAGSDVYSRFLKSFKELLHEDLVDVELRDRGIKASDLGPHSARKGMFFVRSWSGPYIAAGAASYVASGCTAGPSNVALCLRAGWTLGGVEDRYLRYEAAGDSHVGRTVAGLPYDKPEFAVLPPFFVERNEIINDAIQTCFPMAPESLNRILEFCLASLVYHFDFLSNHLAVRHPLRSTPLFSSAELLPSLKALVHCRLAQTNDVIQVSLLIIFCLF